MLNLSILYSIDSIAGATLVCTGFDGGESKGADAASPPAPVKVSRWSCSSLRTRDASPSTGDPFWLEQTKPCIVPVLLPAPVPATGSFARC